MRCSMPCWRRHGHDAMAVMRVATFAANDRMLNAALRTQARMAQLQMQQASGSVATDYGGLGKTARSVLDLEATQKRAAAYAESANQAINRVEVMYATLSTIADLLTDFRGQLTAAMGTDASGTTTGTLVAAAGVYMQELAALLNTTFEGRYLFAGDATGTAPVDLTGYTADAATPSTAYYGGDETVVSVRISADQSVSYGVTASNTAFEQAFRAFGIFASAAPPDADLIQQSYEILVGALDATIAVQSGLSIDAGTLERAVERHADYDSLLSAAISELKDVDIAAVAVRLATYETQLQASYATLAKLQSLNLVDYLR